MGWRFPWASSFGFDFNYEFGVSFTNEEIASGRVVYNFERSPFPLEEGPGLSVFLKTDSGDVFHTYSTYARGGEAVVGAYHYLDFVPKGATRMVLRFRCHGCGITIVTVRTMQSTPSGRMSRRLRRMPAARRRRTRKRSATDTKR